MEKISFKEVFNDSLNLIQEDKKRFGIILIVMITLGFGSDLLKGKFLGGLFSLGSLFAFVLMSLVIILIAKEFIEKNRVLDNESLKNEVIGNVWKSFGVILLEGLVIICALLVFLIPLAIILAMIGPKLGKSVTVVAYFAVILFSAPLIIVNIMISYSLQFLLIKKLRIVDSVKSSYFLVKNQFKRAMIIGIKINFFYYLVIIAVFKINIVGSVITSGLGMLYVLMTTFTYYKLMEENQYEI